MARPTAAVIPVPVVVVIPVPVVAVIPVPVAAVIPVPVVETRVRAVTIPAQETAALAWATADRTMATETVAIRVTDTETIQLTNLHRKQ